MLPAIETTGVTASTLTPAVNEAFSVSVRIDNSSAYSVMGTCVRFDATKIRLVSQAAGSLSPFVPDSRSVTDINTSGEVRTGMYAEAAGPTFPDRTNQTGTVVVLNFTRIAAGNAVVSVPARATATPFGLVLIKADAVERVPAAPASITLTDPTSGTGTGSTTGTGTGTGTGTTGTGTTGTGTTGTGTTTGGGTTTGTTTGTTGTGSSDPDVSNDGSGGCGVGGVGGMALIGLFGFLIAFRRTLRDSNAG